MIVVAEQDAEGTRVVSQLRKGFPELEIGVIILECDVPLYCPNPRIPHTIEMLESVLSMMKWL